MTSRFTLQDVNIRFSHPDLVLLMTGVRAARGQQLHHGYWGEGVIKVICCQSGTACIPPTWDPSRKCPAPAVDNLMLWESPTSDRGSSSSTWWSLGSTSNGKWERKGNSAKWNNPPCLQSLTKGTWQYRLHLVHCRSLAFLFWVWMAPKTSLWC